MIVKSTKEVNEMNIPGFNAEASLRKDNINFLKQCFNAVEKDKTLNSTYTDTVVPQLDICYPISYPCYSNPDGSVEYCTGIQCTESGWEPGAGPPPGVPKRGGGSPRPEPRHYFLTF
jgi:hypothetical protein